MEPTNLQREIEEYFYRLIDSHPSLPSSLVTRAEAVNGHSSNQELTTLATEIVSALPTNDVERAADALLREADQLGREQVMGEMTLDEGPSHSLAATYLIEAWKNGGKASILLPAINEKLNTMTEEAGRDDTYMPLAGCTAHWAYFAKFADGSSPPPSEAVCNAVAAYLVSHFDELQGMRFTGKMVQLFAKGVSENKLSLSAHQVGRFVFELYHSIEWAENDGADDDSRPLVKDDTCVSCVAKQVLEMIEARPDAEAEYGVEKNRNVFYERVRGLHTRLNNCAIEDARWLNEYCVLEDAALYFFLDHQLLPNNPNRATREHFFDYINPKIERVSRDIATQAAIDIFEDVQAWKKLLDVLLQSLL